MNLKSDHIFLKSLKISQSVWRSRSFPSEFIGGLLSLHEGMMALTKFE
jgi:hypothetical protein